MNNNLQRHMTGDRIKWIAVTLAVLLLAAAIMAAMTKGFQDWNPYGWFGKKEEQKDPEANLPITDENGNELESGETYPLPRNLIFRAASKSTQTVTLRATITPLEATNKNVTWAAEWKTTSSWSSGKNVSNYLTLTQSESEPLKATVSYTEAFGEQIEITVASEDNPSATASCIVDCKKQIESFSVTLSSFGTNVKLDPNAILPVTDVALVMNGMLPGNCQFTELVPVLSTGTVQETYSVKSLGVHLNPLFVTAMSAKGVTVSSEPIEYLWGLNEFFLSMVFGTGTWSDPSKANLILNTINERQNTLETNCTFYFDVVVEDTAHATKSLSFACNLRTDNLLTRVESITIDRPTLVF